ncbi:MAG: glycine zipper family protein [Pyrinomonadaceae bacterium]
MKTGRRLVAMLLVVSLLSIGVSAQAQRSRKRAPATPSRSKAKVSKPKVSETRGAPELPLTGLYRLDEASSENPREAAERVAGNDAFGERGEIVDNLTSRLQSPAQIAIERRGNQISIASTRAQRISFIADGHERVEKADDGHTVRTRATLYGNTLAVNSTGSTDDEFSVTFDSIDEGRRLRVTRRILDERLNRPVIVQSIYNKVSNAARWNIYGEQQPRSTTVASSARSNAARNATTTTAGNRQQQQQQPAPPTIRPRPQQPAPNRSQENPDVYVFVVPRGAQFVTTLNNDLSTQQTREGDRFTLTVREPAAYAGATIEGFVSRVNPSGRITGRSEMTLEFQSIRLRDGRTAGFSGTIESVRATGGEEVRVSTESTGNVQESDSQTARTEQRVAIGAAVGAIIGAIAKGGKGAAIGAIVGAGVGAGSVYAQGRDDLELRSGTELVIRTAPR